jgi:hypothetical protein
MATELQQELYRVLRDAQDKYIYFLLAAAGGSIGLAVSQTQNAHLAWSQLPLGVAIGWWGLSFFFGCRHIAYINSTLYANAELLRVQAGEHPEAGSHPQIIQAASIGILKAMESNSERANRLHHWQFRSLILGGVFFVVWHIVEMYLRP